MSKNFEAEARRLLLDVYTETGVEMYLNSRNTMLNLERPIDMLRGTPEAETAMRVIGMITDGNF